MPKTRSHNQLQEHHCDPTHSPNRLQDHRYDPKPSRKPGLAHTAQPLETPHGPLIQSKCNSTVDRHAGLESVRLSGRVVEFRGKQEIFCQGDAADGVMYIQKGSVKLTVVNESGKEAVVAIFGPGDFFGEGGMAGQAVRMGTAKAVLPTTIIMVENDKMMNMLHEEHKLSDLFITCMLARNNRIEADLIDQLFNSTEKRLARALLLLARYGGEDQPNAMIQKISQTTLAEMVGTTRPRVNLFMNKFRKLGFIDYDGKIKVNASLLTVVLHD
jgi:CRP/FNR family transcriptional regulator, cyclic AMP receptor protein